MQRRRWWIALLPLAAGTLWGMIGLFVRQLYSAGLDGMDVIAIRSAFAALIFWPALLLRGGKRWRIRGKDLWIFAGLGLASIVFFNWCYFTTMRRASLSVAATLLYAAPAMVLVMSALCFRERLTKRKIWVCALTFLGCALSSGWLGGSGAGKVPLAALATGLGSAFGFALYSIFGRYATDRGYRSDAITAWTFLIAAAGALAFCRPQALVTAFSGNASLWGWSLALGVGVTWLPYLLYASALRRMGTGHSALWASIEPVVASLTGLLAFGEHLTWSIGAGILLILFALSLLVGSNTDKTPPRPNTKRPVPST